MVSCVYRDGCRTPITCNEEQRCMRSPKPTPPAASAAGQETRRIVLNLQLACVASCGCDVKTPEVKFHFAHCRYRQIMEALDLIESLTAQLARAEAEKAQITAAKDAWIAQLTTALKGSIERGQEAKRKLRVAEERIAELRDRLDKPCSACGV